MPKVSSHRSIATSWILVAAWIPRASAMQSNDHGQSLWETRPSASEVMLDEHEAECPGLSGFDHLFAGSTFFNLGQYDQAILHFQQATQNIPETHKAHATSLFNSASALHASSRTTEALQTLDTLLQLETHTISSHVIGTNMASMQITLNRLHSAKLTLDMIDRAGLNGYWNDLVDWNYFHLYLKNNEFGASDSIWSGSLRRISPEEIPSGMQDVVLPSLLATQDLEYFARFREVVLDDDASELKAPNHPYHELFSPFETLSDIAPVWQQFIAWEKQYREFVRNRFQTAGALDEQLIESLEAQLAAQTTNANKLRNYLMILLVVGLAGALTWMGMRYMRQKTKIKAFEKLVAETQHHKAPESEARSRKLTPTIEEFRQIGEAIFFLNNFSPDWMTFLLILSKSGSV
jgi:tetratricopeptide (TPR) repeat protein